ncbi:ATP-dependent metallopeptidase FtsH/Yme1/Tma family protein [Patescibacteria group bacterium]|nr:MAG: ATP-dependent metallopeptidase FtsH/Yme1/Tma family protein [Patescibacteria group bacterium]
MQTSLIRNSAYILIVLLILFGMYALFNPSEEKPEEISLTALVEMVNQRDVERVTVKGDELKIDLKNGEKRISEKEEKVSLTEYGIDPDRVEIDVKNKGDSGLLLTLLINFLPFLLLIGFFWFIMRQAQKGSSQALSFGQSKARLAQQNGKERITFKDVAGAEEAKQELYEVIDFLKHPGKFRRIGAKIPKGVLLVGPPGTGKTLMAKAVAGEAKVPFFNISGSEFVEMFVGVGASRVRDLFNKAKKNTPCIIFIDEIDAVGRQRGAGLGGSHDEREQTLNQILVEMDGFSTDVNVIVIAATNRPDILDPALLRPGRFDRRVVINIPDLKEREAILKVHTLKKPLASTVNLRRIARQTVGFSGADLSNLVNEAAILAARKDKQQVGMREFSEATEKVMLGPERKTHILSKEEKKITAYHEAGHALVSNLLPRCDPVHKVSIISRGMAAGYTWNLPEKDIYLQSQSKFDDDLAALLAGRAAEKLVFGEVTTGAENDLRKATKIAREMVKEYGMSDLGPLTFGHKEELVFLGRELGEHKAYSEEIAAKIDYEIQRIINKAYKKAFSLLKKNKPKLEKLTKRLVDKETVEGKEFVKLVGAKKI